VDAALEAALQVFWSRGFAATSLDELADAMDMNRPSMANAFGDKEQIYRRVLARFVARMDETIGKPLLAEPDLERAIERFLRGMLEVYFGPGPARGCLVFCTAPVEALGRPRVRADAKRVVDELDDLLESRFAQAQRSSSYPAQADARAAAQMTQAMLHSLALRARTGASRASLVRLARHAARVLASGVARA
jgi:AcrR family transcriptional regulator